MSDEDVRGRVSKPTYALEVTSTPKPPKILCVRFLGPIKGILTHYGSKGSVPCGDPGYCEPRLHRTRQIWKGYASALLWRPSDKAWVRTIVEITEAACEAMNLENMRGQEWELRRVENDKGHKIVQATFCQQLQAEHMPAKDEILPVLLRFYRVSSLKLGVDNPLPKRTIHTTINGSAPLHRSAEDIDQEPPMPVEAPPRPSAPDKKLPRAKLPRLMDSIGRMPGETESNGNGPHS